MTHHLLVASEQLWPNLLGLAALQKRDGGIATLHILHTDDLHRSKLPAERIRAFAQTLFPDVAAKTYLVGMTSQEVLGTVHQLLAAAPNGTAWTFNCSGGTKMMFAGLLPFLERPEVEAFYREVTGQWYRMRGLTCGELRTMACEEWEAASLARLEMPVHELAPLQMEYPAGSRWTHFSPPLLDLFTLIEDGVRSRWNWSALQRAHPTLSREQGGFAFEDFFGALVRECGAHNLAANLELSHDGKKRHEFDLIASNGQNMVVFDLKLSNDEEGRAAVIDQLSRLSEDRRSLGGLGAVAVAIRPSWSHDVTVQALARGHGIQLWTQEEMGTLVQRIVQTLGSPAPASGSLAARLDGQLQAAAAKGEWLFSRRPVPHSPVTGKPVQERHGFLALDTYLAECAQLGVPLVAVQIAGRILLRANCAGSGWKTCADLEHAFLNVAWIDWCQRSSKGTGITALLQPLPGNMDTLQRIIQDRLTAGAIS